jgi:hypothetical protein
LPFPASAGHRQHHKVGSAALTKKRVSERERERRAHQSHQSKIEGWITEYDMAAKTGRSLRALRKDRQLGVGMAWSRFGKSIFYRESAAAAYLEAREVQAVREAA